MGILGDLSLCVDQIMLTIRPALDNDFNVIWPIFHQVVGQTDTYPYPPDTSREQAWVLTS